MRFKSSNENDVTCNKSQTLLLELVELLLRRLRHRRARIARLLTVVSILNVGSPLLPVLIPRRVADVLLRPNLLNDDVRHAHRFLNAVRVQTDRYRQVHPDHGRLIGSLDHALSSFIGGSVGEGRKSHDGGSLRRREREV